jgi:probable F420-dependent oxidoreductase
MPQQHEIAERHVAVGKKEAVDRRGSHRPMTDVTVGYLLPTQEAAGVQASRIEALLELGAEAERAGFDTVWLPDSPFQYGLPDPLLMLAALASRTERVTLATGVLLAGLRQPALLAQQLASLDAIAGGRLRAGFGLGFPSPDSRRQFAAAGVPFATRSARLEQSIELMRTLWSAPGRPISFAGEHVVVRDLVLSPAPARPGGPPIWLAGAGDAAERRVGRLADGWLPYLPEPAAYANSWQHVQAVAQEAGRREPPVPGLYLTVALDDSPSLARERLRTTVQQWYGRPFEQLQRLQAMYAGTPDGLRAHVKAYTDAGARHFVVRVADEPRRGIQAATEAIRHLVGSAGA